MAKRNIMDVPTEELLADLERNVSGGTRERIQAELDRRQGANPLAGAQTNAFMPQPVPTREEMTLEGFAGNIGPSAMRNLTGIAQGIGNLVTSPFDTIAAMPAGIADHYGSRYNSLDQAALTGYQDPVGALLDVPVVGTGLRFLGAAGKVGALNKAGRALEKVDPIGATVGLAQGGIGAVANRFATPAESMAGSYYGQPRGRQIDNPNEYLGAVDVAIEEGIPATVGGFEEAAAAQRLSGEKLAGALDEAGRLNPIELIQGINTKIAEAGDLNVTGPYVKKLEEFKADLVKMTDDDGYLSAANANKLKSKYDSLVNFDATTAGELSAQQGALAGSNVIRGKLSETVGPEFAEYSTRANVTDIVKRGMQEDLKRKGSGITGDLFAQGINAVAPVLTGQGRLKRMQGRQAIEQGRYLDAVDHILDPTLYGRVRQGGYLGETTVDETWHVGRLWSE